MRWKSRLPSVGEIRARATLGSKINPFSGLLEPLARGIGSDGEIFAKQIGGGHGKGKGNCVDDGQRWVRVSSFNLPHVRAINVATPGKFFLTERQLFASCANILAEVPRNIHDVYVYMNSEAISTDWQSTDNSPQFMRAISELHVAYLHRYIAVPQ